MSGQQLTPREAVMRLGASTAEAIAQVLEMFAPGAITRGDVTVMAEGASPFTNLPEGAIAASVSYIDGVSGANIFVLGPAGGRRLAQAMGVPAPESGEEEGELSELEISAVAEAANQMMAAASNAISMVIGQQIEISPPDIRVLEEPRAAVQLFGSSSHACSTTFLIGEEPCRLIQLVPNAFVVRMARALEELSLDASAEEGQIARSTAGGEGAGEATLGLVEALGEIKLRVWAELGRTRRPLGAALSLGLGEVVELDRPADSPVELFVNGVRFAQGRLLVTDDGEWALRLEEVTGRRRTEAEASPAHATSTPEAPATPETQGALS